MKSFLRDHRFVLAAFAIVLLARIGFQCWADSISAPPLDAPIAVASKGVVDQRIRIRVPDSYNLRLEFHSDARGLDYLRGVLDDVAVGPGGEAVLDGVRVPLRWSLSEAGSGRIVAQGDTETAGASSWSSDGISRDAGRFAVQPGDYRLQARVGREVPELAGIDTRLLLRLHPKSVGSWQTSLVWDGVFVSFFLVDPMLWLLGLFVLWRAIRAAIAARRPAAVTAE